MFTFLVYQQSKMIWLGKGTLKMHNTGVPCSSVCLFVLFLPVSFYIYSNLPLSTESAEPDEEQSGLSLFAVLKIGRRIARWDDINSIVRPQLVHHAHAHSYTVQSWSDWRHDSSSCRHMRRMRSPVFKDTDALWMCSVTNITAFPPFF